MIWRLSIRPGAETVGATVQAHDMSGSRDNSVVPEGQGNDAETVRVECKADRRVHGLEVEWMKGALFEFDSVDAAEEWMAEQDLDVPGTLFLAEASGDNDRLSVDYHVKYSRPE